MLALFICIVAFVAAYYAGRKSISAGMQVVLVAGYAYGILRANIINPFSHFVADAAVVGFFAAQLFRPVTAAERKRLSTLRAWVFLLVMWPVVLFLIPVQDFLVQVVGLRASILVLGFLIIGARMERDDYYRLAVWCAALNILAFGFAAAEYLVGIEPFYPQSAVTEIMYRSKLMLGDDVGSRVLYRIPATFSSAHAYGGTMVMTLPLLLGGWVGGRRSAAMGPIWHRYLLLSALPLTVLGVFMSAARQHAVMLFLLLAVTLISGKMRMAHRAAWIVGLIAVGALVIRDARLQRFTTLEDDEMVIQRVQTSVNAGFIELAGQYPMGNGIGGGGTSMPYFLTQRVRLVGVLENEYGRILLEQGIPGVLLWLGFVAWLISRGTSLGHGTWAFGRRLAWFLSVSYFLTAVIGMGLLASIPQSYIFFLLTGWVGVRERGSTASHVLSPVRVDARLRALSVQG